MQLLHVFRTCIVELCICAQVVGRVLCDISHKLCIQFYGVLFLLGLYPGWHHQRETFSALLALCEGNPLVTSGFPSQRPVTQSFDVFFDLRLSKRLNKWSKHQWSEIPLCSLWCHCNASDISDPFDWYTCILQGCFIGTGAINQSIPNLNKKHTLTKISLIGA